MKLNRYLSKKHCRATGKLSSLLYLELILTLICSLGVDVAGMYCPFLVSSELKSEVAVNHTEYCRSDQIVIVGFIP